MAHKMCDNLQKNLAECGIKLICVYGSAISATLSITANIRLNCSKNAYVQRSIHVENYSKWNQKDFDTLEMTALKEFTRDPNKT